ncbi:MAG: Rpn family recombination-promoting nuclease/putative transposase [Acidobacteriota bacterium]|nr:Rpn family recombination-promoting nuclease/putative transposase [Acidobacteriota bacterium]
MGRLIRLDWAIKKILRDKANFEILEGFLSELLRFDIRIQEILESESNQDDALDKHNRVDLLVKNQDGQLIIIEVQNESEADYLQRLMYGTSKAMVEHMRLGTPYAAVKKLYSVSIVYFDLGEGDDYLYHGTTTFRGMRMGHTLALTENQKTLFKVDAPKDLFPEYYLIKVPKYDDAVRDTLDEWIYFLKNEEIKDSFKARGLQSAKEKLDILKMSEEERRKYESYLEDLRYQASMVLSHYGVGKLDGHKEGHKEGRIETAERMLRAGISPESVAEMTALTLEDVHKVSEVMSTEDSS